MTARSLLTALSLSLLLAPNWAHAQGSCGNLLPGDYDCTLGTPDGDRSYQVHVPASVTPGIPAPLVIDMHGWTLTASDQRALSGWEAKADSEGFIVSWPQGLGNAWNSQGECCAFGGTQDDVAFIESVVAAISAAASIDPNQVFATGLSNGGSQSHTMACESADLFAAVAPVSFSLSGGSNSAEIIANCNPSRGIPVIHFHGTADELASYTDGVLDSLGAQESLDAWVQIQSCDLVQRDEQISPNTLCETHAGCTDAVSVTLCTVADGTHFLYGQLGTTTIPDQAWAFFQSFQQQPSAPPVPSLLPGGAVAMSLGLALSAWSVLRPQKRG